LTDEQDRAEQQITRIMNLGRPLLHPGREGRAEIQGVYPPAHLPKRLCDVFSYLRVANVQSGYLDLSEMKTVTIRAREKERYLLQKGDIVLTEGGDFDKLGRGFIWKGAVEDCIHQNHIFAVRVNRSRLLPEFFAHLSQSPYGKAYFLSVAHKTTNLACINTTKLKGFPILIPPKAEQEKIVQMLESIDNKLAYHARKKCLLEALFRALLHQLMTAQLRVHDLDLDILECGDVSPLSRGATRRAGQSADLSAHSKQRDVAGAHSKGRP
jgi:hypothetical protein